MSYTIILGARSSNGIYTLPSNARDDETYVCLECNDPVFIKKGTVRRHHFCHYTSNCTYYLHPSESAIHNNAKLLIKSLLDSGTTVSFIRTCSSCKIEEEYELPVLSDASEIITEYRFTLEQNLRIADIAYLHDNSPLCMIEIYHTHKTKDDAREEPWFEVCASDVLKLAPLLQKDLSKNKIQYRCIRQKICEDCCILAAHHMRYLQLCDISINNMSDEDLEFYVRYRLGQRLFGEQLTRYYEEHPEEYRKPKHLRIAFESHITYNNIEITKLFNSRFTTYGFIILSCKGLCNGLIQSKFDAMHSEYEHGQYYMASKNKDDIDYSGQGTIHIIMDLLKRVSVPIHHKPDPIHHKHKKNIIMYY
jgi:hypothetical protein